ncbi:SWPV1-183 [Shearwaterpox virus]|uniref:SWPV1-183 n=1 Tax=Shearwaterpox virus TaxID=1974596 RepID=A0A1V0S808_CNPV|nr:SWPV1-183 [Shearwaterpox virus]
MITTNIHRKGLLLTVFLNFINLVITFVKVETPEPYLLVPKNSSVNITCFITDDQGAGQDKLTVIWKLGEKKITSGIKTTWDKIRQKGSTVLHITNVSEKNEGNYTCIVLIKESFDYKKIKLQTVNIDQKSELNSSVHVIPFTKKVDMWDGPPVKISCTFKFLHRCIQSVKIDWWKLNTYRKTWDYQYLGVSWWSNEWGGKGWLNITNPSIGKTEGDFVCIVKCGNEGNFGTRKVSAVPHQGPTLKAEHAVYNPVKGMDLIMRCIINKDLYTDYGWWFKGSNIYTGKKYSIESKYNTIELIIHNVNNNDVGTYICWISKDDWWETAYVTVYFK